MGQGRLPKVVAGAVVLMLHAVAIFTVLYGGSTVRRPDAELQFVSFWPSEPARQEAVASPAPVTTGRSAKVVAPQAIAPIPGSQTAIDLVGSSMEVGPDHAIDWQQEAAVVARKSSADEEPPEFSRRAAVVREPCQIRERLWFSQPKLVLPPGAVPIGKHCYSFGNNIQCVAPLGAEPNNTDELLAALRNEGGPSVPDVDRCN